MAIEIIEDWDSLVTADIVDNWAIGASPSIQSAGGRNGTNSLRCTTTTTSVTKTISASATKTVGFSMKVSTLPVSQGGICVLFDAGTAQCSLRLNPDGTISVYRSTNTTLTGGTSTLAIIAGAVNYIEWKVTISDSISANTCVVRVNGVEWVNVTAGQDVKATANSTVNQFRLSAASNSNYDFDDVYVTDGTTFLGDSKGVVRRPTANGTTNQFTPSAGSNYECVDDTAPDDDTTYNLSSTAGHIDLFTFPALSSTPNVIHGVKVGFAVRKDDAGEASVAAVCRSGGTNYFGSTVACGTTYTYVEHIWELNPATSTAWTQSSLEAAEFGYTRIA
jgi:hypothetical protein